MVASMRHGRAGHRARALQMFKERQPRRERVRGSGNHAQNVPGYQMAKERGEAVRDTRGVCRQRRVPNAMIFAMSSRVAMMAAGMKFSLEKRRNTPRASFFFPQKYKPC